MLLGSADMAGRRWYEGMEIQYHPETLWVHSGVHPDLMTPMRLAKWAESSGGALG